MIAVNQIAALFTNHTQIVVYTNLTAFFNLYADKQFIMKGQKRSDEKPLSKVSNVFIYM